MSIINQTLRELDARRPPSAPTGVPLQPVATPLRRKPVGWVVGAVALIVMVAGGWYLLAPAETVPQAMDAPPRVLPRGAVPASDRPAAAIPAAAGLPAEAPIVPPQASLTTASAQPVPEGSLQPPALARAIAPPDTITPSPPAIRKDIVAASAEDEADERYRKAVALLQKGRENLARPLLEEALGLSPTHLAARQTLAALLSEAGQNPNAEAVLREGLAQVPDNAWFALSLARLQAARGDADGAAATLLGGVEGRGVDAEYRATLAALLMRLDRHAEAARHYSRALELQPDQGTWWMGLGLALEAQGQIGGAQSAFRRALATGGLPDRMEAFVRAKSVE